jgi:hypothetical protein
VVVGWPRDWGCRPIVRARNRCQPPVGDGQARGARSRTGCGRAAASPRGLVDGRQAVESLSESRRAGASAHVAGPEAYHVVGVASQLGVGELARRRMAAAVAGVVLLCAGIHDTTIRASCDSQLGWPRSADAISVNGYVARVVAKEDGAGDVEVAYRLDVRLDLAAGSVADLRLEPGCVDPPFAIGATYLILTGRPTTPEADGSASLRFDDRSGVAWRVFEDGTLSLLGYGDGLHAAPAFVRAVRSIEDARALVTAHRLPDTSTAGGPGSSEGWRSRMWEVIERVIDAVARLGAI